MNSTLSYPDLHHLTVIILLKYSGCEHVYHPTPPTPVVAAVGLIENPSAQRRDEILPLHGGGHYHGHGHGHATWHGEGYSLEAGGHKGHGGYGFHGSIHIHDQKHGGIFGDVDICPEIVLAGVSALGAAGLLAMYVAATQNTNGRRKRRRQLDDYSPLPAFEYVAPLIIAGKE